MVSKEMQHSCNLLTQLDFVSSWNPSLDSNVSDSNLVHIPGVSARVWAPQNAAPEGQPVTRDLAIESKRIRKSTFSTTRRSLHHAGCC